MASVTNDLPFKTLEYSNVTLDTLRSDDSPIVIARSEDRGYQELLAELETESTPSKLLCEAIRRGDEDMFRQESLNLNGSSTLAAKRQAVLTKRPDFLRQLLEKDSFIEDSIVTAACEQKDHDSIRILLEFGWPIDKSLNSAASLLCTAVDDEEFMQWLIERGADVNARSRLDESALSIAIAHGSMDVVRLLLAQGTDITHGDLLHSAAQRKNQVEGVELVEMLLSRGANVNDYRYNNNVALRWRGMFTLLTPLHIACRENNVPVARALLQCRADLYRMSLNAGVPAAPTPLDIALESGNPELIACLGEFRRENDREV